MGHINRMKVKAYWMIETRNESITHFPSPKHFYFLEVHSFISCARETERKKRDRDVDTASLIES